MLRLTHNSLRFRLWLVVILTLAPILLLVMYNHHQTRTRVEQGIHEQINTVLTATRLQANKAHQEVGIALQVIARSNELTSLDPDACKGITRRMLASLENFDNLGAAYPDGNLFCSALPGADGINVADHSWFKEALHGTGVATGEFRQSEITLRWTLFFGYPMRTEHGELRAVLFAALSMDWLGRLMDDLRLPPGWAAALVSHRGTTLEHYPERSQPMALLESAQGLVELSSSFESRQRTLELSDADGRQHLYALTAPDFAPDNSLLVVEAPLELSLQKVARDFHLQLALLMLVGFASILGARHYIRRLIERWTRQVLKVTGQLGAGQLDSHIEHLSGVSELDTISASINTMVDSLQERDTRLRLLSMAIEQSPESIVITGTDARINYVNTAFLKTTGYEREELIGQNPRVLNAGWTPKETYIELWASLCRGEVWRGEFHNRRKDGSAYIELATIAPVKNEHGDTTHFVAVKENITARKQSEQLLHRLAYFDALTGLPNRSLLNDRLNQAVRASASGNHWGLLMLLDIDRFQKLNDSRGHACGDRLLQAVAERLQKTIAEEHTIARRGDDDFAIVIENLAASEAEAVRSAEQLARELHEKLNKPYNLGKPCDNTYYATLSIGISLFHGREHSIPNLLKQAEVALHAAKESGRNAIRFFNPEMQATVDAHIRLEAGLREALLNEEFRLYYQPQMNRRGKVVGAEALLRWPTADGGMVSPAEFIPLAEESGMINALGEWVLRTACRQLSRWQQDDSAASLSMAVNISARQFRQTDFVVTVREIIRETAIDPSGLKLELTESVILDDVDEAVTRMDQLRELGVRFSLDDFGTGFSSLSYLKRLPVNQLKIDRSFISDMTHSEASEGIVLAILSMCQALKLEVIAEGVETAIQRDFLRRHGCDQFQGYLFGKPAPIEEWDEFLALR